MAPRAHREIQRHLPRGANYGCDGALATASQEDAAAKAGGSTFQRGPLWGVPIVTKANTSMKGLITTDGWQGYMIPGHELVAPKDATIVARLALQAP